MGNKARNEHKHRTGKLLDLSRKQQKARQDWIDARPNTIVDKIENAIRDPSPSFHMSWGLGAIFDLDKMEYVKFDKPGKMRLDIPTDLGHNMVRTEKTDAISRRMRQAKKNARY